MNNILFTQLTPNDLKQLVCEGIREFFADQKPQSTEDEIGGVSLCERITGLKPPTIYSKVSKREIPHFKRGGKIRFSAKALTDWVKQGERKTSDVLALEASAYSQNHKPIKRKSILTR